MYQTKNHNITQQRGLSLIETMITMVLTLVILAGVFQLYLGNKHSHTLQEEVATLQENTRFALEFIANDIRGAGYNGCKRTESATDINMVTNTDVTFDPTSGIQGWEATGTDPSATPIDTNPGTDPIAVTNGTNAGWTIGVASGLDNINAVPDSDIIRVWYASEASETLVDIASDFSTITLTNNGVNINAGDIMVLSDCERTDYVMACSSPTAAGVIQLAGACTYAAGIALRGNDLANKSLSVAQDRTSVRKLQSAIYYVGKPGNVATNPPALYKKQLGADTLAVAGTMVVEGVENMQLLYGEDTGTDNVADRYRTADQVTDWNKVVNIKISLLMSTQAKVASAVPAGEDRHVYDLNGVLIRPPLADTRLRRVFSTTVTLRNRV